MLCILYFLVTTRVKQLTAYLQHLLLELNVFRDESHLNRHVRSQRIGTRCYFLILVVIAIVITLYSSLTSDIRRETVLNLNMIIFNKSIQQVSYALVVLFPSLIKSLSPSNLFIIRYVRAISFFLPGSIIWMKCKILFPHHFYRTKLI